jgi:tetratricopeptide (TPR) repeat protein
MAFQTSLFLRGLMVFGAVVGLLGWFVVRTVRNAEDPARMVFKWVLTIPAVFMIIMAVPMFGLYGPMVIGACGVLMSALWTPHIGAMLAKPLTSMFDGGDTPPEPKPAYSVAQARRKQGKYLESVIEVEKQLARFPTDFEGQMLLAQLHAEDLKDLPAAEATILELCNQPGHAPVNIAYAFYTLADWHLKIARDREAAQRALEEIGARLPNTEFALTAAHRIAHLAGPDAFLPHDHRKFEVGEGIHNIGLLADQQPIKPVEKDPAQEAAEYVRHLQIHPLDTEAREKLSILYADHYHRLDLAADQLDQMIQMPNQPGRLVVRWLNLLADLQIRNGSDFDTIRQTLQRIIDLYPTFAAAETARKRVNLLKLELKANQQKQAVKLGTYEQNIGLKQSPVRGQ